MLETDPKLKRLYDMEDIVGTPHPPREVTVFGREGILKIENLFGYYSFTFKPPMIDAHWGNFGGVDVHMTTGNVRYCTATTKMNAFLQQQGSPEKIADEMIMAFNRGKVYTGPINY